ncbi:MBL fold metallo-hydrolase [Patulibacter sp. NPDC049589]|uniref:MBL fold metallo-hydrolase n=1 Tax=Patulibacter sp. NPDC049589 TaxID=3154731 RepID=UPI003449F1C1
MSGSSDEAITSRLRDAALHRVSLSAANEMGRVNAWIVDDDPLTLVDAGTRGPGAIEALDAGFRAIGRRVEDVGLVVLTHQHTDHLGLVAEVVRRSGADVAAFGSIGPYLGDFEAEAALDRAFMADLLRRHGATDEAVAGNTAGWAAFHRVGEAATVTVPLAAGSRLTLRDRTLEVLHRPGHSETDVLLVDAERRMLLGGDHLLRAVPSVPVRDRPLPAGDGARPYVPEVDDVAVTVRYRESLRATRPLPVDLVLPGHGGAFADPAAVVVSHLERQRSDAEGLLRRAGAEPFTAAGLATEIWPQAPATLAHVLLSSVLGGLGLLRADGLVETLPPDDAGVVRFVAPTAG